MEAQMKTKELILEGEEHQEPFLWYVSSREDLEDLHNSAPGLETQIIKTNQIPHFYITNVRKLIQKFALYEDHLEKENTAGKIKGNHKNDIWWEKTNIPIPLISLFLAKSGKNSLALS